MATKPTKDAAAKKAPYIVISPLQHDGDSYAIGDQVELTNAEAAPLMPDTVKPAEAKPTPAEGEQA